jgi:dolichol-phosphate mannosyltransferase
MIFVDDGSADGSYEALLREQQADPAIRIVKMLRNFGQHPAITAGLLHSFGAWVVLMDDDLQIPPEEIGKLYDKAREGFDVVCGARVARQDGLLRRLGSRVAHWLMGRLFEGQTDDMVSSFRIISRRVVDTYLRLPETHTYVAALVSWLGFPQASVPVRHEASGLKSRYTPLKLLKLWLNMAFAFSDRPLRVASWAGVFFSLVAGVLGLRVLFIYLLVDHHPVPGYTSLFVSQMFLFGVTLVFLGILGEYVGRVYREVKRRPYFIIDYRKSVGVTEAQEARGRSGP